MRAACVDRSSQARCHTTVGRRLGQELLDSDAVVAAEREADAGSLEDVPVALDAELLRALLEERCLSGIAELQARKRTDEERAGAAHARRVAILQDCVPGPLLDLHDPLPLACELLELRVERHGVHAVVRSEAAGDLVVLAGEATRLPEVSEPDATRDRRVVDVGQMVGVADPVDEARSGAPPTRVRGHARRPPSS